MVGRRQAGLAGQTKHSKQEQAMNKGKVGWAGNYPAVITPFTKDGAIDDRKFVENVKLLVSEGADGIIVSGSNGESWALEPEERLHITRLAVGAVAKDIPVLAGTGGIITHKVAELTAAAKDAGAAGAMIMPPYYAMVNRKEVVTHYKAISDRAKLPIMLYNSPAATGVNLTASFCEELAEIEYVVAIKQSVPDFIELQNTVDRVGEQILVFTGSSGKRGLAAAIIGVVGFVSSEDSHVMGAEGIALWDLCAAGRFAEARVLQSKILRLKNLLGPIGTAPASMKAAMNLLGRPGGHCRRPILDLDAAEVDRVRQALASLGYNMAARAAE
jgi:4-hydroxy-tetrahydrodipicolinate synthase